MSALQEFMADLQEDNSDDENNNDFDSEMNLPNDDDFSGIQSAIYGATSTIGNRSKKNGEGIIGAEKEREREKEKGKAKQTHPSGVSSSIVTSGSRLLGTTTTTLSKKIKTEEGEKKKTFPFIKQENIEIKTEQDDKMDMGTEKPLKEKSLQELATLRTSQELQDLLLAIKERMSRRRTEEVVGPIEDDDEYQLIVKANEIMSDITNEIAVIHKYLRDIYAEQFPELESLVVNPLDYARVVQKIRNETDMTIVDLSELLPAATIMVVSVTASTTLGVPLSEKNLDKALQACDEILALHQARDHILEYVESRMTFFAPNLTAIVGSSIAAKLMSAAGGITALSKMPSCNLQLLGTSVKTLAGFSTSTQIVHAGSIYECDLIQKTPSSLRKKASRLVADKCTLAARVDLYRDCPSGAIGREFSDEIRKKIDKLLEPPPGKQIKPLAAPDDKPKKKRGGRKARAMKEKYAMTDLRKQQNRISFAHPQETSDYYGKDLGMMGQSGTGKIRINISEKGITKLNKKAKQKLAKATAQASGLSSSLAFTPVQGLELYNPEAAAQRVAEANQKYFSGTQTFLKIGSTSTVQK